MRGILKCLPAVAWARRAASGMRIASSPRADTSWICGETLTPPGAPAIPPARGSTPSAKGDGVQFSLGFT